MLLRLTRSLLDWAVRSLILWKRLLLRHDARLGIEECESFRGERADLGVAPDLAGRQRSPVSRRGTERRLRSREGPSHPRSGPPEPATVTSHSAYDRRAAPPATMEQWQDDVNMHCCDVTAAPQDGIHPQATLVKRRWPVCDVTEDASLITLLDSRLRRLEEAVRALTADRIHVNIQPDTVTMETVYALPQLDEFYAQSASYSEARAVHRRGGQGQLVKQGSSGAHMEVSPVTSPELISDLNQELLQSGIAVLPGCRDHAGVPVVLIFTRHGIWESEAFHVDDLVRTVLYYRHTLSDEIRSRGLALVIDARGIKLTVLNSLLRAVYCIEASVTGALSIVHVLVDRVAQSLIFRSSVFRPQANIKIDLISSISALYRFVDPGELPAELGGQRVHNHANWCRFRQRLEPVVQHCRVSAQYLVTLMEDLSAQTRVPGTVEEARLMIAEHDVTVHAAFADPRLACLKEGAAALLGLLDDHDLQQSADLRDSLAGAKALFRQVQETVYKVEALANRRLEVLEQSLAVRAFQHEAAQLIAWLRTCGQEILDTHSQTAENLKGARQQQKEFEKSYFTAMSQIEKANDVLEEGGMLSQAEESDEVTGVKDVSRELRARMEVFTQNLDGLREKIENTAKCYHLLDKSYEWALEAMRHVATMKMDQSGSTDAIDDLRANLETYLTSHPPLGEEKFAEMSALASSVDSDRLREQCTVAHARCRETDQMLRKRLTTLHKAKEQLGEARSRRNSLRGSGSLTSLCGAGALTHRDRRPTDTASLPWEPRSTSTPASAASAFRRRSYAGKSSTPVYSPLNGQAGFARDHGLATNCGLNLSDFETNFFRDGLITSNMSDRIVTCLPKGLSRSTLRSSRESLRDSRESLHGSSENLTREQKSNSLPPRDLLIKSRSASTLPADMSMSSASSTHSAHAHSDRPCLRPARKHMRRAVSMFDDHHAMEQTTLSPDVTSQVPGQRCLSMITGSTESLPSMAEEDEFPPVKDTPTSPARRPWSPCDVNAHLVTKSRGLQHHGSLADLRLTEEQVKHRRNLSLIMREILATERDYVRALEYVIDNYIAELARDDIPQVLRGKRSVIFGNLEKIHSFHAQCFLHELEACERNPTHICHAFLAHQDQFYLYAFYNKNKPKSDQLMSEYGATFFKRKQRELGDRMDLASYLLKPVQRMGKYALLLKQLLKEAPEQEHEDVQAALDMVKFQLRHGNDLLAMDAIRDCDINLQEQGELLRQEEFLVWSGRKKCLRRVFLFQEAVVFTKTRRAANGHDIYLYKHSMKTADIGLTETVGESGYKFGIWFRKRTSSESYTLQSSGADVKHAWVRELSRLLWRQAIRNKENRMQVMANMGIGNKPCMDLKASKDNINDRFVNISLKCRAGSLGAVPSLEQLKNGGKRPHSIISVSSTSSSSSSNNSACAPIQYGAPLPNLPEDHVTSVKGKSCTMCSTTSNESGIVADVSGASSCTTEDACTQTTLKRGAKIKDLAGGPDTPALTLSSGVNTSNV